MWQSPIFLIRFLIPLSMSFLVGSFLSISFFVRFYRITFIFGLIPPFYPFPPHPSVFRSLSDETAKCHFAKDTGWNIIILITYTGITNFRM